MDLLSDRFRAPQRHPAIALDTSLVFDGDPGDEIFAALSQSANRLLAPILNF
jgi:hypothetical protein